MRFLWKKKRISDKLQPVAFFLVCFYMSYFQLKVLNEKYVHRFYEDISIVKHSINAR